MNIITQYLKKLHTQERAVEEVKLAIKPYYQRKDINKEEYKDILRKAVHKVSTPLCKAGFYHLGNHDLALLW